MRPWLLVAAGLVVVACGGAPVDSAPLPPTSATTGPATTVTATTGPATTGTATSGPATTVKPPAPVTKVVVVGDIACPTDDPSYNEGKGTARHCQHVAVGAQVVAAKPAGVLLVGDLQYRDGTPAEFDAVWNKTWATLGLAFYPVPGNHEYNADNAVGFFRTFPKGFGTPGASWYRFEAGSWVVLALDSNCGKVGGCTVTAAQTAWLRAQLAGVKGRCVAAMWHHPMVTSTDQTKRDGATQPAADPGYDERFSVWWSLLREAGVTLVLNGHAHNYERFGPLDAQGKPAPTGPVQFVVGTGGHSLYPFAATPRPGSQFRADQFGHLELELGASDYTYRFVSLTRGVIDEGRGACTPAR